MKFRKVVETYILNEELLDMVNEVLECDDKEPLTTLENLTIENYIEIFGEDWFYEEFEYASDDNSVITIVE